jgi:hypothetical protein
LRNPKVFLQISLRQFPCLTKGSVIAIRFNERDYRLKILKTEPAPAVCTLQADVICEFAPPVTEFDHNWDLSDTDSSSDEALMTFQLGHTLRGELVLKEPGPIRSTLEQREKERRDKPPVVGVTYFVAGQPIPPPKPAENKKSESAFQGVGTSVKKSKKHQRLAPKQELSAQTRSAPSAFVGIPKTLKTRSASGPIAEMAKFEPGRQQRSDSGAFQGTLKHVKVV